MGILPLLEPKPGFDTLLSRKQLLHPQEFSYIIKILHNKDNVKGIYAEFYKVRFEETGSECGQGLWHPFDPVPKRDERVGGSQRNRYGMSQAFISQGRFHTF
jgi:hypothetical protein